MNRRGFLRVSSGLCFASGFAPITALAERSAATASERYRNALVLIELKGGNDGLNTVVPFGEPAYYALRPRIAVRRDEVVQLDEHTGLHPSLAPLLAPWQAGQLAIVQGVGYARPNLSHFRSIEIWDTASRADEYLAEGWLARAFATHPTPAAFAADGIIIGSTELGPLAGTRVRAIALADPGQLGGRAHRAPGAHAAGNAALAHILRVEANVAQAASRLREPVRLETAFPAGPLGQALRGAARVLALGSGAAVVRVTQGGYDTHQNQSALHGVLLRQLAEGLVALRTALIEVGRWDSTLVMTYSEFGRRPAENGSGGTDHGTAGPQLVMGGRVRGGIFGLPPSLDRLDAGNLAHAVDFRSAYATVLERWWGIEAQGVLGGRFGTLDFVRA